MSDIIVLTSCEERAEIFAELSRKYNAGYMRISAEKEIPRASFCIAADSRYLGAETVKELHRYASVVIALCKDGNECLSSVKAGADCIAADRLTAARAVDTAFRLMGKNSEKPFIKTFGSFDIYVNGTPLRFKNAKAKELLALCADRCGGEVTIGLAVGSLWENRPLDEKTGKLYRKAKHSIIEVLKNAGAEDMFICGRGFCRINVQAADCDLYDYLDGKRDGYCNFHGEYMTDYSWAEDTAALLCEEYYRRIEIIE